MAKRHGLAALAALLWLLTPTAAPAQGTASLTVTPSPAGPGQTVHLAVAGLAAPIRLNITYCVGILGPGRNVELNRPPAFRPEIGTIAIDAAGQGASNATLPADLVAGSYQVIVGGCSPHRNIAPLSTVVAATLTVVGGSPSQLPRALPSTGGGGMTGRPLHSAVGRGSQS